MVPNSLFFSFTQQQVLSYRPPPQGGGHSMAAEKAAGWEKAAFCPITPFDPSQLPVIKGIGGGEAKIGGKAAGLDPLPSPGALRRKQGPVWQAETRNNPRWGPEHLGETWVVFLPSQSTGMVHIMNGVCVESRVSENRNEV